MRAQGGISRKENTPVNDTVNPNEHGHTVSLYPGQSAPAGYQL